MPSKPTLAQNRNTYIPPNIQSAMNKHMEQTMPANLRQYVGENRPAYIPKNIAKQINQHMEKTMPTHLKQYSGAYVQQHVVERNVQHYTPDTHTVSQNTPPPIPQQLRRDHTMPVGEQQTVELNTLPVASRSMFEGENTNLPPSQPEQQPAPIQPSSGGSSTYEFIMSDQAPPKKSLSGPSLPGLSPRLNKILLVLVGLIVLIIIFAIGKSIISGPSNVTALTSVVQDQQALIHIMTNALNIRDLSTSNKVFASTANLSISSGQSQLTSYMAKNGHKIDAKTLILKVSSSTDLNLTNAESSGDYNQIFEQTASQELNTYLKDLNTAYQQTKGVKGRALLIDLYKQTRLLVSQVIPSTNQ